MRSLPSPRGPITERLIAAFGRAPGSLDAGTLPRFDDPLADDDLQLALYLCYELHYRGLPGVDDRWEWDPRLLDVRGQLELEFERGLLDSVPSGDESVPA